MEQSALREETWLLGDLLGETIKSHEGDPLLAIVETLRRTGLVAYRGSEEHHPRLAELVEELPPETLRVCARAYAHFLSLINIAEQRDTLRRWRMHEEDDTRTPPPLDRVLEQLAADHSPARVAEAIDALDIELVLTAHPTEVARRTLIAKHLQIARLLETLDRTELSPDEELESVDALRREITAAWLSDEIRRQRPTPVEEAKWGFAVIEHSLWDAVPRYLRRLDRTLRRLTGRPLAWQRAPIRFGSWMGGDRDGNPNVTPATTREVVWLARWMAADLYGRELRALRQELSMTAATPELRARVPGAHEPYRELLREPVGRLDRTKEWIEALLADDERPEPRAYLDPDDLLEPLRLCDRSLRACGAELVADGRLLDLMRRIACFGLALVRLDIRQESTRHTDALAAITRHLGLGDYATWDEAARIAFLRGELAGRRPLIPRDLAADAEVADVLATFRMLARLPRDSLGLYVISMARAPSDVLAVALLQREAGIAVPLPIAPLFETLADLDAAGGAIDALLADPWYRDHVGTTQPVMIGYSDSAKDAGLLAASWAQYRAQERLVEVCRRHGKRLRLFHGRGGSIGRGGAPTSAAIRSQPPGSVDCGLRVTEQGEVIRAKFGMPEMALLTLETYTEATLGASLAPPPAPRAEWRALMERLAAEGAATYRALVRGEPDFVRYFRQATPEPELGRLAIGSRPARRRAEGGVESLRAIPWIFAWTQNRLILPSWLGTGAALERVLAEGAEPLLHEMHAAWPFFATLLDMMEMVIEKTDLRLSEEYERQLVEPELWPLGARLRDRFEATRHALFGITGDNRAQEMRRALAVRNAYTAPLNLMQIRALNGVRGAQHDDEALNDTLLITIAGIAAGLRNTG